MPAIRRRSRLRRTTVFLEPDLHRALKVKARATDRRLSELINEAVRLTLREESIDLEAIRSRSHEPGRPLERVLADLTRC